MSEGKGSPGLMGIKTQEKMDKREVYRLDADEKNQKGALPVPTISEPSGHAGFTCSLKGRCGSLWSCTFSFLLITGSKQ